jgi:tetratricopeptide (TPR) repeat protein
LSMSLKTKIVLLNEKIILSNRYSKNMKNIILIFAFLQLMSFSLIAQTSNEKIENFKRLNREVVDKFEDGKFKDASRAAEQALGLSIEIFGREHNETAAIYSNLGEIYRAARSYDRSVENFEKALAIYRKLPANYEKKVAGSLKSLGIVLALDGKKTKGEEVLLRSLANAEQTFGKEGEGILPYLQTISEFYVYAKELDKANEIYIRLYLTALKVFGEKSEKPDDIKDEWYCAMITSSKSGDLKKRENKFYEAIETEKKSSTKDRIEGEIVNGKALFLAKPDYVELPLQVPLRFQKGGLIPVRVRIDKEGNVNYAKALCGESQYLRQLSEDAAYRSRFKPTTVDGIPVEVRGIIIYNWKR